MQLSIITVNYNDKNILKQIQSVQDATSGLVYEQIVSDNASSDGSIDEIRKSFPDIKIIENKENLGFGRANNGAVKIAKGDYILFLNPDMLLQPNSLKKMVDWFNEDDEIAIASCKLIDEHGKFDESAKPRRFPTFFDQAIILLKLHRLFPSLIAKYMYEDFDSEKEQEVDSVRGSFMLVKRDFIKKLGYAFDPRYFIWFEDVDICREAKKHGYKVVYTPIISAVDHIGQTFKKEPTFKKAKWFTSSMYKYFQKWEQSYASILIVMIIPMSLVLSFFADVFENKKMTKTKTI